MGGAGKNHPVSLRLQLALKLPKIRIMAICISQGGILK